MVVVGGDGTVNEVVNGLVKTVYTHITLGYIPTGSGNDFARGLGLTKDTDKAVEQILSPACIEKMDIGIARSDGEKRCFLISAGIGFDASICHEALNSGLKDFPPLPRGYPPGSKKDIALPPLLFCSRHESEV